MTSVELSTGAPDARRALARGWIATALAAIALTSAVLGLVLGFRPSPPGMILSQNIPGSIATFVLCVMFTAVGLILRRRRIEHSVGWLVLLFGVSAGVASLIWAVVYVSAIPGGDRSLGIAAAWFGTTVTFATWTHLATRIIVRFPSGEPETVTDRRVEAVSLVVCSLAAVFAALRPGPFLVYPAFHNPAQVPAPWGVVASVASVLAIVGALVVLGVGAANMVARYRRAAVVERLQLRWFAFAGIVALTGAAVYISLGVLIAPNNDPVRETSYVVLILAVCSLPAAILQAMTRHRLYDIDTIIGRTFAYGALTAILAGLYAASLRLFNALFVAFTGQTDESALVLSTLVLAMTFTPIKTRLELIAAKRFKSEAPGRQPKREQAADADAVLDARIEAAVRKAVDDALRARDSGARPRR